MSSASISNPGATASITSATAVSLSLGSWDVQVADISARAAYDGSAAGFSVLVSDTGSGRAAVYTKNSATSADWSDPAYYTGPTGATGATGPAGSDGVDGADGADGNGFAWRSDWALYTNYIINDVAHHNDVSYVCVATHTANNNDEPGVGAGWDAKWDVFNHSDMLASTYDPTGAGDDAFSMDNMAEGANTKIMTAAERVRLGIVPVYVATRTALKALSTSNYTLAFVTESGTGGLFSFRSGDYSAEVTADTEEGVYVEATDTASTSGAWVREGDFLASGLKPEWFGADGTSANDHTGITKADALARTIGSFVSLERRIYNIAAPLVVYDGSRWIGSGWHAGYDGGVQYSSGCVIKLAASSDCNMIEQVASPSKRESFYLADFALYGDGGNQTNVGNTADGTTGIYQLDRAGIYITDAYNTTLLRVRCENMRGAGFQVYGKSQGVTNLFFESCSAYNCRTYCAYIGGAATDVRFSGQGDWGYGRCGGVRLGTSCTMVGQTVWASQCQDPTEAATHSAGTGTVVTSQGGIIMAGDNNKVSSCRSEGHAGHGIKIANSTIGNEVSDNTIYAVSSTATTTGSFDGINIGTNAARPHVTGNKVKSALSGGYYPRYALMCESGVASPTILGNDLNAVGANGVIRTGTAAVSGVDPTTAITDWSWISTDIKAYVDSVQNITAATTIFYNTESYDQTGEFNNGTYTFVPLHSGEYTVEASVLGSMSAADYVSLIVWNGTSEEVRIGQTLFSTTGKNTIVGGSKKVHLTAGTSYTVRATPGSGTFTTVVGSTFSFLRITRA